MVINMSSHENLFASVAAVTVTVITLIIKRSKTDVYRIRLSHINPVISLTFLFTVIAIGALSDIGKYWPAICPAPPLLYIALSLLTQNYRIENDRLILKKYLFVRPVCIDINKITSIRMSEEPGDADYGPGTCYDIETGGIFIGLNFGTENINGLCARLKEINHSVYFNFSYDKREERLLDRLLSENHLRTIFAVLFYWGGFYNLATYANIARLGKQLYRLFW